jgi:electron transfer flavoprotein alpha subunit
VSDSNSANVLCFLELDDEGVLDASLRALTFARSLAQSSGAELDAVSIGPVAPSTLETLSSYGVGTLHQLKLEGLDGYAPRGWARALSELTERSEASALVAAGSDRGNEVLANVGAMTGLPMVANCLRAAREASSLHLSRQRWAGSLIEDATFDVVPALLSVASDGVLASPASTPVATSAHDDLFEVNDEDSSVRVAQWISRGGGVALADARVVVGGGRGVGSEEGFAALDELADLLGAAVGVSRAVTSAGWRPHAQQVGQTGTRISAELYLACGISGATQHLAGCRSAKHVVTINTDADAPFLSRADYAVVGDLSVIVPALVSALRARSSS